jgi:hypothetical protein
VPGVGQVHSSADLPVGVPPRQAPASMPDRLAIRHCRRPEGRRCHEGDPHHAVPAMQEKPDGVVKREMLMGDDVPAAP